MIDRMPDTIPPPSLDEEHAKLEAMFRARNYSPAQARKSADNLLAVAASVPKGWRVPE
jgi:hypothetical protein